MVGRCVPARSTAMVGRKRPTTSQDYAPLMVRCGQVVSSCAAMHKGVPCASWRTTSATTMRSRWIVGATSTKATMTMMATKVAAPCGVCPVAITATSLLMVHAIGMLTSVLDRAQPVLTGIKMIRVSHRQAPSPEQVALRACACMKAAFSHPTCLERSCARMLVAIVSGHKSPAWTRAASSSTQAS